MCTKLSLIGLMLFCLGNMAFASPSMMHADAVYETRGEGFDPETFRASAANVDQAIELYKAIAREKRGPEKEEAIWKLLRATCFKARYTVQDKDQQKAIYDQAIRLGEKALEVYPHSIGIHLWVGVLWGSWTEAHGVLKAARAGVANKIKHHAERVIELDPGYAGGAGYRLLGAVHLKAPHIPLILGWPSRDKALQFLEKAHDIDASSGQTKKYLAEVLYCEGDKVRAIRLLESILACESLTTGVIEEAALKHEVRGMLGEWLGETSTSWASQNASGARSHR